MRDVTAEERRDGILSLSPPTAERSTLPALVSAMGRAIAEAYAATEGQSYAPTVSVWAAVAARLAISEALKLEGIDY